MNESLSVGKSYTSGNRDSVDSSRNGRYYASFSFRFHSKPSLDISSFLSDGEDMRMDEFFDDEVIFERKV